MEAPLPQPNHPLDTGAGSCREKSICGPELPDAVRDRGTVQPPDVPQQAVAGHPWLWDGVRQPPELAPRLVEVPHDRLRHHHAVEAAWRGRPWWVAGI